VCHGVDFWWHSLAQMAYLLAFLQICGGTDVLGARDLFCFFENFFAQIFPYRVYIEL
jgi:hypothetical protein